MKRNKALEGFLKPAPTQMLVPFSLFMIVWSIWVSIPFDTDPGSEPSRVQQYGSLPDWIWGGLGIAIGLWCLADMVIIRKLKWTIRGISAAAWYWLITAVVLLLGDWHNASWIVYVNMSLWCVYMRINLLLNSVDNEEP